MYPTSELHILHFNDTYELESSSFTSATDPCGGVARFATIVDSARAQCQDRGGHTLVLHSGDAFSPSILSSATNGRHMVDVFNAMEVGGACVGNHDVDLGVKRGSELIASCSFPWVLSNLFLRATGRPLCDARESVIVEVGPWRVGLMGLVESSWVDTLATVKPRDVVWEAPLPAALRVSRGLRAAGAHVVIALTHMRLVNDTALRRALIDEEVRSGVRVVDAIMGGHDHDVSHVVEGGVGAGIPLIKSGCDFRWISRVVVTAPPSSSIGSSSSAAATAVTPPPPPPLLPGSPLPTLPQCPVSFVGAAPYTPGGRANVGMLVDLLTVVKGVPEQKAMASLVTSKLQSLEGELSRVVGLSCVALDVREEYVRRRETAVGNMMADLMRRSVDADIALLNSGTLRGNCVIRPGLIRMKDMVTLLPFFGDTVVKVRVRGSAVVRALENAVSMWPATDGRFCQVSGVKFSFDPNNPPGSRVDVGSVRVLTRRRKWGTSGGGASRVAPPTPTPSTFSRVEEEEEGEGEGEEGESKDNSSSSSSSGSGLKKLAIPPLPSSPLPTRYTQGSSSGGGGGFTPNNTAAAAAATTPSYLDVGMRERVKHFSEGGEGCDVPFPHYPLKSSIDSGHGDEYGVGGGGGGGGVWGGRGGR